MANRENREEISLLLKSAPIDSTDERALGAYLNNMRFQKTSKFCEWVSSNCGGLCKIVKKEGVTFYTVFCEALIYLREKMNTEEGVYAR